MRRAASSPRCPERWSTPPAASSPAPTSRSRTTAPAKRSTPSAARDGGFTAPSLPGGIYTVTVSLMGFKTATLNSVTLQRRGAGAGASVALQVGALEENVTVVGDSALVVQTQSPSIATNLTGHADHQPAADQPQRARLADLAARLQHFGHRAQLVGQRHPAQRDQHHARRHEHPGQLPEDDRRLLRASDADARLGRGSHGDDGRATPRTRPARAACR